MSDKKVDPREKAEKLVRLAVTNKNGNEARNAALSACKLIAEHDLLKRGTVAAAASAVAGAPEAAEKIRAVATDPQVRATAASIGDAAVKVSGAARDIANLFRKTRA